VETKFYIYRHIFSNGAEYLGKGTGNRAYQKVASRRSKIWTRHFNKYGMPKVEILKDGLTNTDAYTLEVRFISQAKEKGVKLLNLTDGGEGATGAKIGDALRAKYSKAKSGKNHPFYGKSLSKEHKENLAKAHRGKKLTEEHKKKLSERKKGKAPHNVDMVKRYFGHKENGVVYLTKSELYKKYNLCQSHVNAIVLGKRNTTAGWHFLGTKREEAQLRWAELIASMGGDACFANREGTL